MLKRELRSFPGWQIGKDGAVFRPNSRTPEPLEVRNGIYTGRLTVKIDGSWHRLDALLSQAFYESKLIVPRDGNLLDLRAKNIVVIEKLPTFEGEFRKLDIDKVQWIWHLYEAKQTRVTFLAEASGLSHFATTDFLQIIKAILYAGIRL